MLRVTFLPETSHDFTRIYEHYAYESGLPHVADNIDQDIRNFIEFSLRVSPAIGRRVEVSQNMRMALVSRRHWIIYSYNDTDLYIHRLVSARENTNWDNI